VAFQEEPELISHSLSQLVTHSLTHSLIHSVVISWKIPGLALYCYQKIF